MRSRTLSLTRALFALAISAALALGATDALRAAPAPSACNEPLADGTCTTQRQCEKFCTGLGAGTGSCTSGCCYCIWF